MIKSILVALDGSEHASAALDYGLWMAERTHGRVTGLHVIDRERLAALDATSVHRLHQAGYLEGAYLLLSSQHNMRRLIAEKQRRLRLQDAATDHAA